MATPLYFQASASLITTWFKPKKLETSSRIYRISAGKDDQWLSGKHPACAKSFPWCIMREDTSELSPQVAARLLLRLDEINYTQRSADVRMPPALVVTSAIPMRWFRCQHSLLHPMMKTNYRSIRSQGEILLGWRRRDIEKGSHRRQLRSVILVPNKIICLNAIVIGHSLWLAF